jgi:hypothetical protein
MGNFYSDVIQNDPRYDSDDVGTVVKDMNLLEPGTRAAVQHMIEMAAAHGHVLKVAETYRSQTRQEYLYEKGLTKLRRVGCHGYGVAADLQLFVNGRYDPDGEHYQFMHGMAVLLKLVSGQGWGTAHQPHSFTDWDHVQRVPLFRQNQLFAGHWYPPVVYDPYADMVAHGIRGIG